MQSGKPPIGDTISNGKYRIVETLRNGGAQALHRGVVEQSPDKHVLVTTLLAPERLRVEEVLQALSPDVPGRLALEAVSFFDIRGSEPSRNIYQKQNLSLVEQLPSGDWAGRWVGGDRASVPPLNAHDAMSLGLSAGKLLAQAAEHGALMVGARPEYLWAERDREGALLATGISDRYQSFLRFTSGACAIPAVLLRRTYVAPEIHWDKEPTAASLTFSLATMMAEWVAGRYPFHESWTGIDITTLLNGEHIPLNTPKSLAHLLHLGMRPEPTDRPSLPAFLAALESLDLKS